MKTFSLFLTFVAGVAFVSCGPAAENRNAMHSRAKVIGDSIAHDIQSKMSEADVPGPVGNVIKIDTPSTQTVAPK
jgi:hypothetical protein